MSSVTFVTAFINIMNGNKLVESRFVNFMKIVNSGVLLCVYIDHDDEVMVECMKLVEHCSNVKVFDIKLNNMFCHQYSENLRTLSTKSNVKFLESIENLSLIDDDDFDSFSERSGELLESNLRNVETKSERDSFLERSGEKLDLMIHLPEVRNLEKDSKDYMVIINSKIDIVYDTVITNPWNTDMFAWIDFSLFHISTDDEELTQCLISLSTCNATGIYIPGCVSPSKKDDNFTNHVIWRFCGGFFLGDKSSIVTFYNLQRKHLPIFIRDYNTLVWEVNFWSWLESNTDWKPIWYDADHNNSILTNFPKLFSVTEMKSCIQKVYEYPAIENDRNELQNISHNGLFMPSSASYLYFKGNHLLNTRYVNYTVMGRFQSHHSYEGHEILITKNVSSTLDSSLYPTDYHEMKDPPISNSYYMPYNGIEDIRIYSYLNEVKFIGSSMNYATDSRILIITGKYNITTFEMNEHCMIESPTSSHCEKNWVPVIRTIDCIETEHFIYSWSPMQIGHIKENRFIVDTEYSIQNDIFKKCKGSTLFVPRDDNTLIGVIHYSEEGEYQRKYFHMLVMLDYSTLQPLKYSESFYFGSSPGIEYCIGFTIIDTNYHFWISQRDGCPSMLTVPMSSIPLSLTIKIE